MSEEIRIITETLSQLSGTALTAFIWYVIVVKLFVVLLGWIGGITIACIVAKLIRCCVMAGSKCERIVREIRDELELGKPGYLTNDEFEKIHQILPEIIRAYKGERK